MRGILAGMTSGSIMGVLLGLVGAQAQNVIPPPIRTVDEAIDRLPPIEQEGSWNGSRGNWDYHPAVAWLMRELAEGGKLTDDQWRRALVRSGAIRVRERWPAGEPFAVGLEIPMWLPPLTEIRLEPRDDGMRAVGAGSTTPSMCGNCAQAGLDRARYQVIGTLPSGAQRLTLGVLVQRGQLPQDPSLPRRSASERLETTLWQGSLDFDVTTVAELEDALPPARSPDLDAAVRKVLDPWIQDSWLRLGGDRVPELGSTALSLEVELLEGAASRATKSMVVRYRGHASPAGISMRLPEELTDLSGWSIRVRGLSRDVLHDWNADHYWDGELEIPLVEVPRR